MLQWLQRKLFLRILEERSQLEIVLGIERGLHSNVVLNQIQELLLKLVDLSCSEERIDVGKVIVGQIPIVPNFLGNKQRREDERSPVSWVQGKRGEGNQSVDIDETDDAAFRTVL